MKGLNKLKYLNKKSKGLYCAICQLEIKHKDNYVRITDYERGEFLIEKFYHRKCFNDSLDNAKRQQNELDLLKKLTFSSLVRANKMMNKMEKEA